MQDRENKSRLKKRNTNKQTKQPLGLNTGKIATNRLLVF